MSSREWSFRSRHSGSQSPSRSLSSSEKVSTKSNFKSVLQITKAKDPSPSIKEEVMKNNH